MALYLICTFLHDSAGNPLKRFFRSLMARVTGLKPGVNKISRIQIFEKQGP